MSFIRVRIPKVNRDCLTLGVNFLYDSLTVDRFPTVGFVGTSYRISVLSLTRINRTSFILNLSFL